MIKIIQMSDLKIRINIVNRNKVELNFITFIIRALSIQWYYDYNHI